MTRRPFAFSLVVLGALAASASSALPDEKPPAPEDMMKVWAKYATPGEHHAALAKEIGSWDVALKIVMPGAPEQVTKGTAETTWWVKDRFITTRILVPKGMMGMDFEGLSVLGWDNFKQKWVGTSASNGGTALVPFEGAVVDPSDKVRVFYGPLDEFLTGEHDKAVKYVSRHTSPDAHVLEVWDLAIGENGAMVMQFAFTRRK